MTLIKIQKFATKAELKAEQDKTVKLETQNLNYFLGKNFLVMMVLKICFFINQHLVWYSCKKTRGLIIFSTGNQKLYMVSLFLCNIPIFCIAHFFGSKIGIKFDKDPVVVEQNKYTSKIVKAYFVFELSTWPKIPLKNCLYGATNIAKK